MRGAVAVSLACFATAMEAQGRVQGVLLDSLRAMGPLADAEVVLLPGGRRARTDEKGAFQFIEVPPGTYRVTYAPLWLDSIGVAPVSVETSVDARDDRRLVLLTGSRVAMARDRCGGTMDADRSLVVGEVRDARGQPLPGVVAVARWSETHVGRGAPTAPQEFIALDTTRADARFALCGMLEGAEAVVAASHPDGRSTGAIVLTVTPGVFARDLLLGDPARSVRVRGVVANTEGAPIPRAEVLASHATSGIARSDSAGRFELAVLDGSRQLVVRALGFQPRVLDVRIPEDGLDLEAITLEPVETVLDTFVIRARAQTREQAEFEYRRRTLPGAFLDESILERFPAVTPNAIVSRSPSWVRVFRVRPGEVGEVRIFRGYSMTGAEILCRPRLFVDGRDWGTSTEATEINSMLQMAKRVEVFRATFAPPQFADFGGCGALVIWTH